MSYKTDEVVNFNQIKQKTWLKFLVEGTSRKSTLSLGKIRKKKENVGLQIKVHIPLQLGRSSWLRVQYQLYLLVV